MGPPSNGRANFNCRSNDSKSSPVGYDDLVELGVHPTVAALLADILKQKSHKSNSRVDQNVQSVYGGHLMPMLPTPPVHTAVSRTGQGIMTVGVMIGLIVVGLAAVRLRRRWSAWTAVLIPLSTLIAGSMMPMPDAVSNMWYFRPGQMTLWTTYGVSLPLWTYFSYTAFYGGFGLAFWWFVERGATRAQLVRAMGVMWVFAMATEIVGIQLDTYTYYGEQPFRVAGFPIWVSVYNVAICSSIGIASARLRRWLPTKELIAPSLFLAPALIVVGLVGTAFPMLQVTHTPDPATASLYLASLASLTLAATMIYFATRFVPTGGLLAIDEPGRPSRTRDASKADLRSS